MHMRDNEINEISHDSEVGKIFRQYFGGTKFKYSMKKRRHRWKLLSYEKGKIRAVSFLKWSDFLSPLIKEDRWLNLKKFKNQTKLLR